MARTIPNAARNAFEEQFNNQPVLWFASITHPSLGEPLRVSSEDGNISYHSSGHVINYASAGFIWYATSWNIQFFGDDDQSPRARIVMGNPNNRIGQILASIKTSPDIWLGCYLRADWADTVFSGGGPTGEDYYRSPAGTPTLIISADYVKMLSAKADTVTAEAQLGTYDLSRLPWPYMRATPDRLPGLHW